MYGISKQSKHTFDDKRLFGFIYISSKYQNINIQTESWLKRGGNTIKIEKKLMKIIKK